MNLLFPFRYSRFRLAAVLGALTAVSALVLSGAIGPAAWSRTSRVIKLIVPYAAGGPADTLARSLAEQIGNAGGPTVVVENRPGAGGRIGTETVSRAAPDGSTLLVAANPFLIDPYLRKVAYDPLNSFEPICYLAGQSTTVVVNSVSPYSKLADLFNTARATPGKLTLASAGPATVTQIAFEMLKRAAKVDISFVPYAGAAPAVNALLGEHVTAAMVPYSVAAEHVKIGKLRALAAVSRERIEQLPDVPTVAEAGYGDIEGDFWNVLVAPAKTPEETLTRLIGWFAAALQAPKVKSLLIAQGQRPVAMCGADFAAYLRKQYAEYGRIIREADIRAE